MNKIDLEIEILEEKIKNLKKLKSEKVLKHDIYYLELNGYQYYLSKNEYFEYKKMYFTEDKPTAKAGEKFYLDEESGLYISDETNFAIDKKYLK